MAYNYKTSENVTLEIVLPFATTAFSQYCYHPLDRAQNGAMNDDRSLALLRVMTTVKELINCIE